MFFGLIIALASAIVPAITQAVSLSKSNADLNSMKDKSEEKTAKNDEFMARLEERLKKTTEENTKALDGLRNGRAGYLTELGFNSRPGSDTNVLANQGREPTLPLPGDVQRSTAEANLLYPLPENVRKGLLSQPHGINFLSLFNA